MIYVRLRYSFPGPSILPVVDLGVGGWGVGDQTSLIILRYIYKTKLPLENVFSHILFSPPVDFLDPPLIPNDNIVNIF